MNNKVLRLIEEYFEVDIFLCNLKEETKKSVIDKFQEFVNDRLTFDEINERLKGTKFRKLKYHISVKNYASNKAFPVKLGGLKPELQQEAYKKDISLHKYIKSILEGRKK